MGNGQCERFNRTIINMLKSLPEGHKNDWKKHVDKLVFAYKSTANKTTGYSPHYLMFGREMSLPIDNLFNFESMHKQKTCYSEFVDKWHKNMKEAFEIVHNKTSKSNTYSKALYDKKIKGSFINPDDRVLVKNVRQRGGTGKLRSYWESKIYRVIKQKGELPVYQVTPEDGSSTEISTLHRNLLLKCPELPVETDLRKNKVPKTT